MIHYIFTDVQKERASIIFNVSTRSDMYYALNDMIDRLTLILSIVGTCDLKTVCVCRLCTHDEIIA